jgi:hypothetical protein
MEGSPDPRTDGELLAATVTDPEAFAVFYRRHVRGVLSFFRRRVPWDRAHRGTRGRAGAAVAQRASHRSARCRAGSGRRRAAHDEIAAELRCSQSVVRKRVSRGAQSIRVKLKEAEQ